MQTAVIGGGSLGLLWGARLASLYEGPTLFTRTEEQKHKLDKQGLILHHPTNLVGCYRVPAVWIESPDVAKMSVDMLFVMVKQIHLAKLLPTIHAITHKDSHIFFWQNGIGHEEKMKVLATDRQVYAVVTTDGALRVNSHEVKHTGVGETWVGNPLTPGEEAPSVLSRFLKRLNEIPDVKITYDPFILQRMWEKWVINCVINPLTTLARIRNGDLLSPQYRENMEQILGEALRVANDKGFDFGHDEMMSKIKQICEQTANNVSSMYQDVRSNQPTEIEYMNGEIVKWGKRLGVSTPYNEAIVSLIQGLEQRCR